MSVQACNLYRIVSVVQRRTQADINTEQVLLFVRMLMLLVVLMTVMVALMSIIVVQPFVCEQLSQRP